MTQLINGTQAMANALISLLQGLAIVFCIVYCVFQSFKWYQNDEHEKKQLIRMWGVAILVCAAIILAKPLVEWAMGFYKAETGGVTSLNVMYALNAFKL